MSMNAKNSILNYDQTSFASKMIQIYKEAIKTNKEKITIINYFYPFYYFSLFPNYFNFLVIKKYKFIFYFCCYYYYNLLCFH